MKNFNSWTRKRALSLENVIPGSSFHQSVPSRQVRRDLSQEGLWWGDAQQVAPRAGPSAAISVHIGPFRFLKMLQWHKRCLKVWCITRLHSTFCGHLLNFSSSALAPPCPHRGVQFLGQWDKDVPCSACEPRHSKQGWWEVHFQSAILIWITYSVSLWKCSWRCTLSGKICYKCKPDAKGSRNTYTKKKGDVFKTVGRGRSRTRIC